MRIASLSSKSRPIRCQETLNSRSAGKEGNIVKGIIQLAVEMADLQVRAWFGNVQNMAVNVLFKTANIDKYNRGISYMECKIVIEHSIQAARLWAATEARKDMYIVA